MCLDVLFVERSRTCIWKEKLTSVLIRNNKFRIIVSCVVIISREGIYGVVKYSVGMYFVSENYTQSGQLSLDPDPLPSN
jgi:hypothetical protein